MQIDTGFGDVVNPAPAIIEYPALLDFGPARLAAYPAESVIAEKFEAMAKLGQPNSRMYQTMGGPFRRRREAREGLLSRLFGSLATVW